MRLLIAFLLSLCIAFNAAAAAGTDVCDALTPGGHAGITGLVAHGAHPGHHAHDHAAEPAASAHQAPADPGTQPDHGEHSHPHQCFTSVLPGQFVLPVSASRHLPPRAVVDDLLSRTPARLERPPRPALV